MSALSPETVLGPITLLKTGVGFPCTDENRLMGASSGWSFLPLYTMMDRLGLTISWFLVPVGDSEVLMKSGLWRFNLAVAAAVLTSCGEDPSIARAAYLPRSPKNVRVTACRVRDNLLWEHRLARA